MFDLNYYNKIIHKNRIEEFIKSYGFIPIQDFSPIDGICYNDLTVNKVKKLLKINIENKKKIVFWEKISDFDYGKAIKYMKSLKNKHVSNLKKKIEQIFELQNWYYKTTELNNSNNYFIIHYDSIMAYPVLNVNTIHLSKLFDNDIECSCCLERECDIIICFKCYNLICQKCNILLDLKCSVCKTKCQDISMLF